MVSSSWTEAFPGWEQGSYHHHEGAYRRRPDGLSIRVLQYEPPVPCPEGLGAWPADRSWLVSFWRLHASESFHVVGPDAEELHEVLALENVSVATLLVELNKRSGLLAWAADAPGFEWTGQLEGGATPPERAPADWLHAFLSNGWSRQSVDGRDVAERRLGPLVVRVGVDPESAVAEYTPQCWFMEFAEVEQRPWHRAFGGEERITAAGELYFTPWRDTSMVLDHLAGLRPGTDVDAIRSWLQSSTDAAVEFVAPATA
ncbi:hypothetical protein GA0111570_110114 [Raineyella antarctica]|uniref:Uncharacterized protein n=1 Tax=Raineyella antarctica TaxID=1577474 RepID=A0A1G6HIR6_9ACTN|nr:hypothetical protein [Raineyella antarctica]SDB94159.1 hypothetical protein GA0111570_110114 [Raineyella antarctica]